jgi:hypothetical protein
VSFCKFCSKLCPVETFFLFESKQNNDTDMVSNPATDTLEIWSVISTVVNLLHTGSA